MLSSNPAMVAAAVARKRRRPPAGKTGANAGGKRGGVDEKNPAFRGPDRAAGGAGFFAPHRPAPPAARGRNRRNKDQRLHTGPPGRGGGDPRPAIRVPDED